MAWTNPMTAVAHTAFPAADFNTHVRDNLRETAPAKPGVEGVTWISSGANRIEPRSPSSLTMSGVDPPYTLGQVGFGPTFALRLPADVEIPNASLTEITGWSVLRNDVVNDEALYNGTRVHTSLGGYWMVGISVTFQFTPNAGSTLVAGVGNDLSLPMDQALFGSVQRNTSTNNSNSSASVRGIMVLEDHDFIYALAYHNTTGNRIIFGEVPFEYEASFWGRRILDFGG